MKNFIKRITGIEAKEQALEAERQRIAEEAEAERQRIAEEAEAERKRLEELELGLLKKKDPKEYATRKKEPWVSVLDVKVNKENVRNGFFELDWNQYFIQELIQAGYGLEADPEEEIVDRWFRSIVYQMLDEEGLDTNRGSGYINIVPIAKGKSSVS
jgi:hypothetical protein